MTIFFTSPRQQKEFTDPKVRLKRHGAIRSKLILRRLNDPDASDTLEVCRALPGRYHELRENRAGQISADLDHPYRLIFEPADEPPALRADGGTDWTRVRTVRILEITDTHE